MSVGWGQDCVDGIEVELWGECYNIETTTSLNLSNSGLTGEIPPEIGNLINLTDLYLEGNELTGSIPPEIGNLTSLEIVNLDWNQLTEIPSEIGNLTNLYYLDLHSNQFTSLPESICDLPDDCDISVSLNQLCEEYFYDCIDPWGEDEQDQSNCCEGENGELNWTECPVLGCPDPYATNYDPDANTDDGSCEYEPYFDTIWDEMNTTIMAIYIESAELDGTPLDNGDEIGIFDGDACVGVARLDSPIEDAYQIFVPADNPDTPEIDGYTSGDPISFWYWDVSNQTEYNDVDITFSSGSSTYEDFANTTVELSYDHISGCMDIEACNYNPDANTDDGSCVYHDPYYCSCENEILDCMGECGGDAEVDECDICGGENSSCADECGVPNGNGYDDWECNDGADSCWDIAEGACDCEGNVIDECGICDGDNSFCGGCTDVDACNYDADVTVDDGSCELHDIGDMNCDYTLNVLDIVLMANMVLDDVYMEYSDVNSDGFLNILDLVIMVNWVLYGSPFDPITDIDGNLYETTLIGEQRWMAENLRVTHYNNGDDITTGYSGSEWTYITTGAYAVYNDVPSNVEIYGYLYNWYVVDDERGVCPEGFHVPSDDEWTILTDFIAPEGIEYYGNSIAGGKMKEEGHEHWVYYSDEVTEEATNESGFTGLPGGYRNGNGGDGNYYYMGNYGRFWSSSNHSSNISWNLILDYMDSEARHGISVVRFGFSIRCLGD